MPTIVKVMKVQELAEIGKQHIVAALHTDKVEPAEFYRENQLQQRCQEEGRHGDAQQRDDRDGVVRHTVLLARRSNAEIHGYDRFKYERCERHRNREPDDVVELLNNRQGVIPAVAEVAREDGAQPGKVAADDAPVEAVSGALPATPGRS